MFVRELFKQNLPKECVTVFCSLPLYDHRILQELKDVDILVTWNAPSKLIKSGSRLKFLQIWGAGLDKIDYAEAQKRGIIICDSGGCMANAIAEYVLMQILVWERDLMKWDKLAKAGSWTWEERNRYPFSELSSKTLGVVGLGRIGQKVVLRASAFGMKIYGIKKNPSKIQEIVKKRLHFLSKPCSLNSVLPKIDYLSLNIPLTQETYHLIDKRRISYLKSTAVIINTSRGPIIDEEALCQALENNKIRGASLDVTEIEPIKPNSRLAKSNKVILTCHHSGYTIQAIRCMVKLISANIRSFMKGEALINQVEV